MKNKKVKFHFNGEITDYARPLGSMCPDYSYIPKPGDTVKLGINIMGISIKQGIIVRKIAKTKKMISINFNYR